MDRTSLNSAMSFRDAAVHHLSMSETQGDGHDVVSVTVTVTVMIVIIVMVEIIWLS